MTFGIAVHGFFAAAVLAMIAAMWFGLSESLGRVPHPWSWGANSLLLLQFPLAPSLFLTESGGRWLIRFVPGLHGATLATTTYALVASGQLLTLFALWTQTGVIWWQGFYTGQYYDQISIW